MANYSTLKTAVADVVKTNGTQAITGANLQTVLLSIINSVGGGGYIFKGVATPSTNAGTPDENVFYIGGAGTYANFGTSVVVPPTNIAVFKYNGTWTCEQVTVENGGVFDISAFNAVGGTLATYADLATALGTNGVNIPEGVRKGGMSIKFVQSSDNKYVQYRYVETSTVNADFTNTDNWQGVDKEPTPNSHNLVESGSVFSQKTTVSPGKNLFNVETSEPGKYLASSGGIGNNPFYAISDYIKVESGQRYRISADGDTAISNNSNIFICFYSSNKTFISSINATNKNADVPNDASFMRITYQQSKTLIQVEKSSTGRTNYEPYNPIGGYKANVFDNQIILRKFAFYLQNIIKTSSYANGYSIIKDSIGAYSALNADDYVTIPTGFKIKNHGIPVILGSDSSLTQRHDIANGETWVTEFDINEIRSGSLAGNLNIEIIGYGVKDNTITSDKLVNKSIIKGKIDDKAVELGNLDFITSVNLLDKAKASVGKYIASSGALGTNPVYNTTDYIPVKPNTLYYLVSLEGRQRLPRMLCTYNSNKEKNDYIETVTEGFYTTGNNDAFIRVTYSVVDHSPSAWQYAQVTKSERLNYQEYNPMIPSSVICPDGSGVENVYFFLPKHIYVAAGRTIEIYYDQVLINSSQYNIQAICQVGKALERKFQIVGDSQHAGNNYALTVNVFNNEGVLVVTGNSTIHIVSSEIATAKQILPIGDSLTNDKPWLSELHTLSSNLSTVGTRLNYNEGRSGATVSTYTNVSGGIVYDYDSNYRGPGYGTAPDFSESENYSVGDIVKTPYNSRYRYWIYKQNHSAGAFVESECFCLSDGNPFYDYVNDKFSMSFYKTFYSKSYDAIILFLGTNGLNLTPETNPNGALGIKNLIELIREDEPTKPIVVINTIFRSGQNGIGNQGNTDGYVAQSEYKFDADRKILLLAKAIDDLCSSMSNVYLCPVGATHDSKYNFGNNKTQVNPRLTSTDVVYEFYPNDSVHPQTVGYMQMADEIFSTLCAVFNT